jgi:uncharacterized protein YdeI (YjbR/CyaY-like superfamily)
MPKSMLNPKVDEFLKEAKSWKEEFEQLRRIVLDCGLTEDFKWMHPCYTLNNKNVVLIHGFKEYCALLFHKGVLLKDEKKILIQQTENVQSARQIRFTNVQEILDLESTLKAYIHEAIEVEKSGVEVQLKKTADYSIPVEFQNKMDEISDLKEAFDALTPGRQKAYIRYFAEKREKLASKNIWTRSLMEKG